MIAGLDQDQEALPEERTCKPRCEDQGGIKQEGQGECELQVVEMCGCPQAGKTLGCLRNRNDWPTAF